MKILCIPLVMVYFKVELIHSLGSTNILPTTADWNVARSLYSIADIQSCIDKVRQIRFGEHLVSFVDMYIFSLYNSNILKNLHELEVTAYSSGYCLGGANWLIDCGGKKVNYH
jgi:integrator complex subunit 9